MKNTTFKPVAMLLLVLMMLVISIGVASAYITTNFVSVEKYQQLLAERDNEVTKLKNQLASNQDQYQWDIARLKGEKAVLIEQNKILKSQEKAFAEVMRFSNKTSAVKFSRGGTGRILPVNHTKINEPSNLTLNEIKNLLKGKPLYPYSQKIYNWDRKGVNAFFSMGKAQIESGFGRDTIGCNAFGTKDPKTGKYIKFDNLGQSVDKASGGILNGYFAHGLVTLAQIQPRYCPPNPQWDEGIQANMNVLYNKAKENAMTQVVNNSRYK